MSTAPPVYVVKRATAPPPLGAAWDGPAWKNANVADVACFRPESSSHRPVARVKTLYDAHGIYVFFHVDDRYVRCLADTYQGPVYKDACVEFFVEPKPGRGYFNFEMNCGGTLLLRHVTDPARDGGDLAAYTNVPWEAAAKIQVHHSMPATVEPEMQEPVTWTVSYCVPVALFEKYLGVIGDPAGQRWRGNFYKCAENNSHPHFASWAPVGGELNFHQPDCFGVLQFEK